ncbi:amidohydrolase [Polymorphospora lycopeni]|uniref:Amidohydrolase n=1 Tax=Polymorphospora lycopeni TaxID=3140240 RepID=A0ABV5CVY3_9ACTN
MTVVPPSPPAPGAAAPRGGSAAGLKARIADLVDADGAYLTAVGDDVFAHPELAFREFRTADLVARELRALGLTVEEGLAQTGVRAILAGSRPGPRICVLAELDAVRVPDHPAADPVTGAAHACGHNAQVAHLVGVARALVAAEAAGQLRGEVLFFAVPAEEYVDIDWSGAARAAGRIEFAGGKQELVRLGHFDGVRLAMMVHAHADSAPLGLTWSHTGFLAKRARFLGRATHAAAAPEHGVNALGAATVALHAIDAQRETFADRDHIRIHPVLRPAGTALNVVADEVVVDMLIRGGSGDAIAAAEVRVDRSLRAGALALGAAVELTTLPGYLPLVVDRTLGELFRRNAVDLLGAAGWSEGPWSTASTDAGDLSHLMPVLHPTHGGCAGANHSAGFRIVDPWLAYVQPAKALAWTVVDLLYGDARVARELLAGHRPRLTRDRYLELMRATARQETYRQA